MLFVNAFPSRTVSGTVSGNRTIDFLRRLWYNDGREKRDSVFHCAAGKGSHRTQLGGAMAYCRLGKCVSIFDCAAGKGSYRIRPGGASFTRSTHKGVIMKGAVDHEVFSANPYAFEMLSNALFVGCFPIGAAVVIRIFGRGFADVQEDVGFVFLLFLLIVFLLMGIALKGIAKDAQEDLTAVGNMDGSDILRQDG